MRSFARTRHLLPLLSVCIVSVGVIFSPWGSVPSPYLDLGVAAPLVPLRAVALVALGSLPLLALAPETRIQDRSSPRSVWLLQAAAPSALTFCAAVAVAAGAAISGVDALGAVRNLLLGTAAAATLRPAMGPLAFVPAVLGSLLCASLREQRAWWAVTNQSGTLSSLTIAAIAAAITLQFTCLGGPRSN